MMQGPVRVYHGTDVRLNELRTGAYVTKDVKDAWRFGYRRAVQDGKGYVFLYEVEVSNPEAQFKKDGRRDRSFILKVSLAASLIASSPTYDAPFKLRDFRLKEGTIF
jgi:hypothetical protein